MADQAAMSRLLPADEGSRPLRGASRAVCAGKYRRDQGQADGFQALVQEFGSSFRRLTGRSLLNALPHRPSAGMLLPRRGKRLYIMRVYVVTSRLYLLVSEDFLFFC